MENMSFNGAGTLITSRGERFDCTYSITMKEGTGYGDLEVMDARGPTFEIHLVPDQSGFAVPFRLTGSSANGEQLEFEKVMVLSHSMSIRRKKLKVAIAGMTSGADPHSGESPRAYWFTLLNCTFDAPEMLNYTNESGLVGCERRVLTATVDNVHIRIVLRKSEERGIATGAPMLTADAFLKCNFHLDPKAAENLMDRVCHLLSIATCNVVEWNSRYELRGGEWEFRHSRAIRGARFNQRAELIPGLALRDESGLESPLRQFLEMCFVNEARANEVYDVKSAAFFLVESEIQNVVEAKFAMAFIGLESLVRRYIKANNLATRRVNDDQRRALKEGDFIDRVSREIADRAGLSQADAKELFQNLIGEVIRRPLWDLLVQVFERQGLEPPDGVVKKARNDLMHDGVLGSDVGQSIEKCSEVSHALSILILKLLGWTGEYVHRKQRYHIRTIKSSE